MDLAAQLLGCEGFIAEVVARYSHLSPALDHGDLMQIGRLAALRALRTYDPAQGELEPYVKHGVIFALRSKERDARRYSARGVMSLDVPFVDGGERLGDLHEAGGLGLGEVAEIHADLAPVLSRLCRRQRRVYIMRHARQMGVRAIAYRENRSQAEIQCSLRGAERRIKSNQASQHIPKVGVGDLRNLSEQSCAKPRRYGVRWECVMDSATREQLGRLSTRLKCSEAEAVRRLITEKFAEPHDEETGMVEREGEAGVSAEGG